MRPFRPEFLTLRERRYHVRIWGEENAPTLFFLHGWGDTGASFQFVIDALTRSFRVVAPDWRGFGKSQWNAEGVYHFQDYIADLDALFEYYSPLSPIWVVGHSMGGIAASLYAGIRPGRVAYFANLEGFVFWTATPEESPERFSKWLDDIRDNRASFKVYNSREAFAEHLMNKNPRLAPERANFLAQHALEPLEKGGWSFAGDPRHRWITPLLFPLAEAMSTWRRVTARTLWVTGEDSPVTQLFIKHPDDLNARKACFANLEDAPIQNSGHNIHHDQPEQLARRLEDFFPAQNARNR